MEICTFKEICLIEMGKRTFNIPLELKKPGRESASSFVKRVLRPMSDRLGKEDGMDILRHEYFDSLNAEDMRAKRISPPYIPHVTHPAVSRHFINKFQLIDDECQPYEGDNDWFHDF
jgi:hypothetical protein